MPLKYRLLNLLFLPAQAVAYAWGHLEVACCHAHYKGTEHGSALWMWAEGCKGPFAETS